MPQAAEDGCGVPLKAAVTEVAPAKLNLALHVTGRRGDGYHLLDSLVAFAELGDEIRLAPGAGLHLTGPFADDLPAGGNLCLAAARLMGVRAAITLEKRLPVASGLGGGSADAAAVLRGLARAGLALPDPAQILVLGADVPACLDARPARMRGIGEILDPIAPLPALDLVLVNPGIAVSTPAVFGALTHRDDPPLPPLPARFADREALLDWLAGTHNALEAPARALVPAIGTALTALADQGAELARMSGSGASCFGIFPSRAQAEDAAAAIRDMHPDWWVVATGLLQTDIATGLAPAAVTG